MSNTYTLGGFSEGSPCKVVCYQLPYSNHIAFAIEGSEDIYFTEEEIKEGVNVEVLQYFDYISTTPIQDEDDLVEGAKEWVEGSCIYTEWCQGSPY